MEQDKTVPPKQRHTVKRIFDRLRTEHGYTGGLTVVGDIVRELQGVPTKVAYFVMLPFSDALYMQVFPRECTETFQEGHRRAFEFFGGVPRRISYDNSRIAVASSRLNDFNGDQWPDLAIANGATQPTGCMAAALGGSTKEN